MAEIPVGERESADRENMFRDTDDGFVYRRVKVTGSSGGGGGIIYGTDDGTPSGTQFAFVNNLRLQILAAVDRESQEFYADFGTKSQRITSVVFTAPSITPLTAVKTITYIQVGTKYQRDKITWSIA
jgi:hypothetical protein